MKEPKRTTTGVQPIIPKQSTHTQYCTKTSQVSMFTSKLLTNETPGYEMLESSLMFETFLIPPPVIHPAPYVDGVYIKEFDILIWLQSAIMSTTSTSIHNFYWLKTGLYEIFLSKFIIFCVGIGQIWIVRTGVFSTFLKTFKSTNRLSLTFVTIKPLSKFVVNSH